MRFLFFANTDWYLYNFRLATALQLKSQGIEVVMLSPPGDFGARFAAHGIRWTPLPMRRASLNPLREAWTLGHLVRVLRAEQPDLVHNFTLKCAVYGAIAAHAAGVPAVVNAVTGLGYVYTSNHAKARLLRPLVNLLMRSTLGMGRSRIILQNGDDAAAFAAARLAPAQKIRMIRSSGVDTGRFGPLARASSPRRPLRVLLAARLVWEKGIGEFVRAAALLRGQGRDIEFLLAGLPDPGNPRSVGAQEVAAWQAQGLLDWLGHVDDMPSLLRSVDVMALPSYYREGVPKSLIEAAACGLALVTTDLPGCREVVTRDGEDGLYVQPRSAESLAAALARLDDDRELVARLGGSARVRALQDFDERLVIQKTCEVYRELLGVPWPRQAAIAASR